ncbi:hypothetical protein FA13DRAFT_852981 [Coprinellus micaceus]|uniref:F-box domain-containing protein n=1 Tax=Coprinellus micaceus TaxID=71717 RepID=A0A4Y7S1F2_COPMI|nr:hypothetical protein FA13DRAFT_852981 [Coprinellus micaceus]
MENAAYITYPFHDLRRNRAPLVLTYVCSHWRKIAIGTPTLWSSLRIDIEQLLVQSGRQKLYQMWLDRAWGTPVSLDITDIRASKLGLLERVDWIGFLLEHVPYLQYLSTGPSVGNALFKGLLSRPVGSARHLEGLCIFFPSPTPFEKSCHGRLSSLFPNLSQLDLSAPSYRGFVDVAIDQLIHFSCDVTFFEEFLSEGETVLIFSKLVELHVHRANGGQESALNLKYGRQIILPEARMVKIHDTTPNALLTRKLLPIISCPNLEVLNIDNGYIAVSPIPTSPPDSGDFSFFSTFMAHILCLRYLYARHQHFYDDGFFSNIRIYGHA